MKKENKALDMMWTVLLSIASILYMYPIVMILFNSLKEETSISTGTAFKLPTAETFAGLANYVNAINSKGFLQCLGFSVVISVTSVIAILLLCSM